MCMGKNKLKITVAVGMFVFMMFQPLFGFGTRAATLSTEYESEDLLSCYTVAPTNGTALKIGAKSVILMDAKTKTVLYEQNKDARLAPASITKIMSLLLVMEALDNEKLTLDTVVTASAHACSMGGSQIWLKENEQMTVDELLRAAVIASANDATVALAETVAGSEETFVEQMNERAKALGLKNTHFVNACGLDVENHYTSAYDVAVMSAELLGHETVKKYSTVWMDTLRNGKSELVNTNKLVRYYSGCTGLKTGTTSQAGCCVSASAKRGDMELIAVVMGGENSNERFAGAKKLLDYGFANWAYVPISADLSLLKPVAVKNGMANTTDTTANSEANLLLKKGEADKLTQEVTLQDGLDAPVQAGQTVGRITIRSGQSVVGEIAVTATDTVERRNFAHVLCRVCEVVLKP